ncbi:ethanolamine-phosphate cytidylyltransferase [Cystoisospora suis]|uniref:ethanolamine-phosphate cytidylyltransferase n=1 Tax=Cystoisospora suis TaxID=483139 RepID=A0A2C6L114_9APIC|nr:ethanolamine-phosphate cytidylyltransferase [Cystoisospora suis]
MTAVVAASCPGSQETGDSENIASSQSPWQSDSLVSASYLHKLIFLYLRIHADEVLSERLQNWEFCRCLSRLSRAGNEKSSCSCKICQESGAEDPEAQQSLTDTTAPARRDPDVGQARRQRLYCCASIWDPKTTAEADAEFCALRSHLLQASSGLDAGVQQTGGQPNVEQQASARRQDCQRVPDRDGLVQRSDLAGAELDPRYAPQVKTGGGSASGLGTACTSRMCGVNRDSGVSRTSPCNDDSCASSTGRDESASSTLLSGPGMVCPAGKGSESGVPTPRGDAAQKEPVSTPATGSSSFPAGCGTAVESEEDIFHVSSGSQSVSQSLALVAEDKTSEQKENEGKGSRLVDRGLLQRARSESAPVSSLAQHNSGAVDPSSVSTCLALVPQRTSLVGTSSPCSPASACVSLTPASVSGSIPMWQWSRSLPLRRLSPSAGESPTSAGGGEEEGQSSATPLSRVSLSVSVSPFASPPSRFSPRMASRIYVDGVFDLLHSGHFNALRQARQLGDQLVVGVNSDFATLAAKNCRPIYTEIERAEIVRGCKWVDEVVVGTPYEVPLHLLDRLHCGFAAHGDDWVAGADGRDAYAEPRAAGRMKIFKRTEGISTTTIVSRLLQATANIVTRSEKAAGGTTQAVTQPTRVQRFARDSLREQKCCVCASRRKDDMLSGDAAAQKREGEGRTTTMESSSGGGSPTWSSSSSEGEIFRPETEGQHAGRGRKDGDGTSSVAAFPSISAGKRRSSGAHTEGLGGGRSSTGCCQSHPHGRRDAEERRMLMSTKRLLQFIGQPKKPKKGDKIVYVDGSFDVFHVGHLRILEKAKQLGDYLIVGIHDDETVSRVKGPGFPVMNLHERALNVLAMRVVDEVIIGAPWVIPQYLLKQFQIQVVVRGSRIDSIAYPLKRRSPSSSPFSGSAVGGGGGSALSSSIGGSEGSVSSSGNAGCCHSSLRDEDEDSEGAVDPYQVPKELGMYREVESSSSWTTKELVERILANRQSLLETIDKRCSKEARFWQEQDEASVAPMTEL